MRWQKLGWYCPVSKDGWSFQNLKGAGNAVLNRLRSEQVISTLRMPHNGSIMVQHSLRLPSPLCFSLFPLNVAFLSDPLLFHACFQANQVAGSLWQDSWLFLFSLLVQFLWQRCICSPEGFVWRNLLFDLWFSGTFSGWLIAQRGIWILVQVYRRWLKAVGLHMGLSQGTPCGVLTRQCLLPWAAQTCYQRGWMIGWCHPYTDEVSLCCSARDPPHPGGFYTTALKLQQCFSAQRQRESWDVIFVIYNLLHSCVSLHRRWSLPSFPLWALGNVLPPLETENHHLPLSWPEDRSCSTAVTAGRATVGMEAQGLLRGWMNAESKRNLNSNPCEVSDCLHYSQIRWLIFWNPFALGLWKSSYVHKWQCLFHYRRPLGTWTFHSQ